MGGVRRACGSLISLGPPGVLANFRIFTEISANFLRSSSVLVRMYPQIFGEFLGCFSFFLRISRIRAILTIVVRRPRKSAILAKFAGKSANYSIN